MSKCTIENCEIYPGDADLIKSRAREAHAFAGVSRDPADREYARDLDARAAKIWDHLITFHGDRLPEPGEY